MTTPFRTTRMVEFSDTDMAGIVHFARFFCFMEAAEHAFLRSLGLSVKMDWEGEHISFPRVSAQCDYRRPARFEDVLTIETRIEKLGSRSVTFAFTILREEEKLAQGQITTVCCHMVPGKPMESREIPEGIRARLQKTMSANQES